MIQISFFDCAGLVDILYILFLLRFGHDFRLVCTASKNSEGQHGAHTCS